MADSADTPTAPKPRKPAAKKAPARTTGKTTTKPRKAATPKASAATNTSATVKKAVNKAAAAASAAASAAATAAGAKISETVESVDWKAQADQIKAQASQLTTQAGKVARDAAETAKDKTGSAMQGLAKLIADTADTVDSKLGPQYGDYARSAAHAVAGAAKSVDDADIDQLIEEARSFVRKSPAVAIGAAAIAGFVLMRLAKGSGAGVDDDKPEGTA